MRTILCGLFILTVALSGSLASAQEFPYPAKSWGGIVRDGPGTEYGRVTSLREMEPITILERTGVRYNGYDWFLIEYRGRRTGYHWGGIICPNHQSILGTYNVC